VRRNPRSDDAWYNVALAQQQRGELDEAMSSLRRGIGVARHPGRGLCRLGQLHVQRGEVSRALRQFLRAAEDPWTEAAGHRDAGYAYRRLGEIDAAREQFEAALRADPELEGVREALDRLGGQAAR
jgi:Tfp pilus assembly protein PilF